jgi:hypothetical protein
MRLKEQRLWDRMRSNLLRHSGGGLQLQRIENMVGNGIPDVLACRASKVTFMELKVASGIPVRATTSLLGDAEGLNAEQRNWHLDWAKHGGRSWVVIGVAGTDLHWAIEGRHADKINGATLADLSLLCFLGERGYMFWSALEGLL